MPKDTTRFLHESLQDAKTIKPLLHALAKGFAKGEIELHDDDHALTLAADGLLNLRIKAEREDGRCQVALRITWAEPTAKPKGKTTPRIGK